MQSEFIQRTEQLLSFIQDSPTAFHAVEASAKILLQNGFVPLCEGKEWTLEAGKSYFVTRNQSSIIAFSLPCQKPSGFMIAASHTDSPTFKLKTEFASTACNQYTRLNVEPYGGTIFSSWLDRPLSLAGRVVVGDGDRIVAKNVKIDRDLLLIPNVAIHFNRTVNNGYTYNPAQDLLPLFAQTINGKNALQEILANELGCRTEDIRATDLYLYNRTKGTLWGAENEFFSSPRIDNLMCMYGTMIGMLESKQGSAVSVFFAADNEETGSATKQGAGSVFLSDVLDRICECLSVDKRQALSSSMMVSADNGHAKHPNHPELSDAQNAPALNGGVVIKSNAAQKYTTDGVSAALFEEICRRAEVPVQLFANRSDMPGGSTLGSISNTRVPLITVDIGMAQLAMHSSYESAGTRDTEHLVRAMKAFYSASLQTLEDGCYHLNF